MTGPGGRSANPCGLPFFHRGSGHMPGARLPMRNIRDVLRLTAAGMSSRKLVASLLIGAWLMAR